MDNDRDGGDVIYIINGDEGDNQDHKPVESPWSGYGEGSGATASNLTYGGDANKSFQIPAFGSSSLPVVESDRSYKPAHCKRFYSESGCPFGNNCIYIHNEETKTREQSAIIVGPVSGGGFRAGAASRNCGQPPAATAPLAPVPLARTVSNSTMKPLNWRTRICNKWQRTGYCHYGSQCFFAHGEAELQQYGGGTVGRGTNPINQPRMVPNLAATVHVVTPSGSSAAHAGGSGEMSGAVQRTIPSWKVPKKINRIYGDWIDDDDE